MTAESTRSRIAVVGAGVSGLTTAYLLRHVHEVVLFEAEPRLGGHAHTHQITDADGSPRNVDTGFIVHNRRTYPYLLRLFQELCVPTQMTQMSMSIRCDGCGLQYAGGKGLRGLLAQPSRLADVRFRRLLRSVKRFHRRAAEHLSCGDDSVGFGAWLDAEDFDEYFVDHFALPLVACVWSSGHGNALDYPARYLFTFLDHHGMLSVTGSPQWYTVTGGSARYVQEIAAHLPDVRTGVPVSSIRRDGDRVQVRTGAGIEEFEEVVIATHADTALGLLADPTEQERELLGAFDYTANDVVLHRDEAVLPDRVAARASWNYRIDRCDARTRAPSVTYWMNLLHDLPEAEPLLVTLNDHPGVAQDSRLAQMIYHHPVFNASSVAAQESLAALHVNHTSYAGAHLGWGFHEDGCRSGVLAARRLGGAW